MRKLALALVAVLMLSLAAGMPVAASPDDATSETVVVAVGDTDSSLLAANAIAGANDYTVVQADHDGLDAQTVQTLSERVDNGDLDEAIVVGDDLDATVVDLENLDIDTSEIHADEDRHLFYDATLQEWESADSVVLTSTVEEDRQTASVALANEDLGPVLEQSVGTDDLKSALDTLEAETVYVTPGVSGSTVEELESEYTVDEETLADSPQAVAGELADDTEHVAVTHPTLVHHASQVGSGDVSLLVTEDDELGSEATDALESWENTTNVYSTYTPVDVQSHTSADVTEVDEFYDLRFGLLVGHDHGVLVSDVDDRGSGDFEVDIHNIGFGTVAGPSDESVTATWTGTSIGDDDESEYVKEYTGEMEPGATWSVDLSADEIDNGAHPDLDYYVQTDGGGLISSGDSTVDLPGISHLNPTWHVLLVSAGFAVIVVVLIVATRDKRTNS